MTAAQAGVAASGASAATRTSSAWFGWEHLADTEVDDDEEDEAETSLVGPAIVQAAHLERVEARQMLQAMRKTIAAAPPSACTRAELLDVDQRITRLNHEAHAAKPLGQQQKALVARAARCRATLENATAGAPSQRGSRGGLPGGDPARAGAPA